MQWSTKKDVFFIWTCNNILFSTVNKFNTNSDLLQSKNFSKNKPTEQNHQRHAFTSSHPRQVTKKIQKKTTHHFAQFTRLWANSSGKKNQIPPCYYATPRSTNPVQKISTQEQISRTGPLNKLSFTFFSRPSFAHHISHGLSTFTLLFLFSCWYMHNKTCAKCETSQTDYKNSDTEIKKENPMNSKSFSELRNIF